jgi:hypothetical protein
MQESERMKNPVFEALKHNILNKKLMDMTMLDEKLNIVTLEFENGVEMTVEIMEAKKKVSE